VELQQVRYFLATCETLNFTRAAEACNVTQPALTKALKLLEYELGGDLFDRQARPLRLTDLGRHLEDKFRNLQDLKSEITTNAKLFSQLEQSSHTLGIVSTIGNHNFLRFVGALQRNLPGIALSLCLVPQDLLVKKILEGELEIAFMVKDDLSDRIKAEPLYTEPFKLVLPQEHPLAKKAKIILQDINGINYIHRSHCEVNDLAAAILDEANISFKTPLSTDQDAIALQMIEAGLGASLMPVSLISGNVVTREIEDLTLNRTMSLAYLPGRELSAPAQALRELILDKFADA